MTVTNQNCVRGKIKNSFSSGNADYYSVQNNLFSRLLSKTLKIKLYKNIILPVVLCGRET